MKKIYVKPNSYPVMCIHPDTMIHNMSHSSIKTLGYEVNTI